MTPQSDRRTLKFSKRVFGVLIYLFRPPRGAQKSSKIQKKTMQTSKAFSETFFARISWNLGTIFEHFCDYLLCRSQKRISSKIAFSPRRDASFSKLAISNFTKQNFEIPHDFLPCLFRNCFSNLGPQMLQF